MLQTNLLRSTDENSLSHWEKSFMCQETREYSLREGSIFGDETELRHQSLCNGPWIAGGYYESHSRKHLRSVSKTKYPPTVV